MCVAKTASSSLGDEASVRNFVPPPGTVKKPACPARCLSGFCGLKWNAYTSAARCTSCTNHSLVDANICRFGIFIRFTAIAKRDQVAAARVRLCASGWPGGGDGRGCRGHRRSSRRRGRTASPAARLPGSAGTSQRDGAQRPGDTIVSTFTISTRGGSTTNWGRLARLASATGRVNSWGRPAACIASSSDRACGSSRAMSHQRSGDRWSDGPSAAASRGTGASPPAR